MSGFTNYPRSRARGVISRHTPVGPRKLLLGYRALPPSHLHTLMRSNYSSAEIHG